MKLFQLALKMLWRDCRAGELSLLALALVIAVGSSTTISLFADRLQATMNQQAAEFIAGDLAVSSTSPIPPDWLNKAEALRLRYAQTSEFPSVLLENEQMLLAAVKAVSSSYPLRGQLKIADAGFEQLIPTQQGPKPGEVWVDARVLSALNLQLNDQLNVGEQGLKITAILRYEPDKRGDFYSFSPRVMLNQADLAATGVIQPGSRVQYGYQFVGEPSGLAEFKDWLKPQLNPAQRLLDLQQDRPELGSALQRAERYLGLSSIVVILIAGVAIAMASRRYSERHFNASALLRCLGCRQTDLLRLYSYQFLILGLVLSGMGCGLGWVAQQLLMTILKPLLPEQLANPSWISIVLGFTTGLLILLGFALPPLLRLKEISPLRVFRRDLDPNPSSAWLVYGLSMALVSSLIWRYSNDFLLTAIILGGGGISVCLLSWLLGKLLTGGQYMLAGFSLNTRFAWQGLVRNQSASISQILAFTITLIAMGLSFSVRNQLLDSWQQQLPAKAPNHFALNILPDQQAIVAQRLEQLGIENTLFYPIVRGRLIKINQQAVQQRVSKDSQGEAATQRELSLTWSAQLPADNKQIAGLSWSEASPGTVSVEQKLADSLKIKLDDELTFSIGSQLLNAKVVNIRSVQWDTLQPNFYMIFSPGGLDGFPTTFMTSFYLDDSQKNQLNGLIKQFPAMTILEVDQVIKQFRTILMQLTAAINLLLYFGLAAGLTVLLTAVYASLDQRIHEGALLRTLGASRGLLRSSHILEFGLIGGLAGIFASAACEVILYLLYTRLLHISYQPAYRVWLLLILGGTGLISLSGFWAVRSVVNVPPLVVLRKT